MRWSSPVPLPLGVTGGKVVPVLAGTRIMDRNRGLCVSRVAANGTFEFNSEVPDNRPLNNTTLTADRGLYALHLIPMNWDYVAT